VSSSPLASAGAEKRPSADARIIARDARRKDAPRGNHLENIGELLENL
jgi:hypothetical protein